MTISGGRVVLVVGLLAAAACTRPPAVDDGFGAKMAGGCHSTKECDALHLEAERRFSRCLAATRRSEDCASQYEDNTAVGNMGRAQEKAADKAHLDASEAKRQEGYAESDQFKADSEHLGSSCSDIGALEAAGAKVHSEMLAGRYRGLAAQRRSNQVSSIRESVRRAMSRGRSVERSENPAGERERIATAKAKVEELRCYDAAAAGAAQDDVDAWALSLETEIAAEEKCRATPHCMAARLARPICSNIAARKAAVDGIATERRNPSGYVNPNLLHDYGRQIQQIDVEVKEQRAEFATVAKMQFSESLCSK